MIQFSHALNGEKNNANGNGKTKQKEMKNKNEKKTKMKVRKRENEKTEQTTMDHATKGQNNLNADANVLGVPIKTARNWHRIRETDALK